MHVVDEWLNAGTIVDSVSVQDHTANSREVQARDESSISRGATPEVKVVQVR